MSAPPDVFIVNPLAGRWRLGAAAWTVLLALLDVACDHDHLLGSYDRGMKDGAAPVAGQDANDDGLPQGGEGGTAKVPTSLPLGARHLAFDPRSQRLFATVAGGVTVPGADAIDSNSLVVIDAVGARILSSTVIGVRPTALGLSDDGTTAWVGLDGTGAVRKADLTKAPPVPGLSFTLPRGSSSQYQTFAASLWVLQESTSAIAVSLKYDGPISPNFVGVAIFDDGVARAMRTPEHTGAATLVRGEAGWLFGFDSQTTSYAFCSLPITATGVTQLEFGILIPGTDNDLVYAAGRVYGTTGPVVDVSKPTAPVRAGTFAFKGVIAPVPAKKRAFMISLLPGDAPAETKARLRVLDTEHFVEVSGVDVPGLTAEDAIWDLVQTSDTQLVFLAGDRTALGEGGRVVFLPVDPLP
jgi:hypothetical protein